ncbi:MAG: glycosyltransferase family 4 protein, partial [Elusimicrobia bacterium]|nr:glycosyltransferase family 4 protein [Elusimicrobiota bacterium]
MNKFRKVRNFRFTPETTEFVILSFEGPDNYALAGGLSTRVRGLAHNLAEMGYTTHLFFLGDPSAPGLEEWGPPDFPGKLYYHRWCQWISRHYPGGVYDGEIEKLKDFENSIPQFVAEEIIRPAASKGKITIVMAEEWHTALTTINLSDYLWKCGLRNNAILLWNANNVYSFERINWGALNFVSNITTVSKYMKHQMWSLGLNPTVIPNGIPDNFFKTPPRKKDEKPLHTSTGADMV